MKYFFWVLKGMGMGAADVVPGVSGGTIAFITGIYERLIESLKSFDAELLKLLFKGRWKEMWQRVQGDFLLCVFAGIGISVFSLARLLKYLLETQPILIWAFFMGLIIASAIVVSRRIERWNLLRVAALLLGTAAAWIITRFSPAETSESLWFVFVAGAIAICAMILPGISGAFILLLMGKYAFILEAVSSLNIPVLLIFMLGAITGLLSFSKVLSWLFRHYHDATVALLAGFMIGSLNKIWPWKQTLEWGQDRHGEAIALVEKNITPGQFQDLTGTNPELLWAVVLCITGMLFIFILSPRKTH